MNAKRLLLLHLAVAFLVAAVANVAGAVEVWATRAWLLTGWVLIAAAGYVWSLWRRFVARALEGYPGEVPTEGIVVTGSVSSRVVLDFDAGTAEKAYGSGTPLVRWLYWICFQAPFPYTANEAALETALHRRRVVGLLTKFWFGEDIVAPMVELRRLDSGHMALVTELVRGDVPRNIPAAQAMLRELTTRFLESGLPVWQVADYNPRAIGNLMETADGGFMMIDLESNLVTPFLPPAAIVRSIRLGQYPSFDDVDIPRLRGYVESNAAALRRQLGEADAAELVAATERLADAQARWFESEPRWPSRILRFLFRLIDVPSWVRGVRGLARRGESSGESFVREGVDTWVAEGHISAEEGANLERALSNPEVALVLANLGAHLAVTIPLRFPFGSLTRFSWTLGSRLAAEWRALRRKSSARTARRVHTIPVMLAALLPSVGSGAYLLATPLRRNIALEMVAVDSVVRRLPFQVHERVHVAALTTWFARAKDPPIHWEHMSGIRWGFAVRWRTLAVCPTWYWGLIVFNLVAVVVGAVLHFRFDQEFAYGERGMMASIGAGQLAVGSVLGMATYRRFWRGAELRSPRERAGSFLWGLSGVGLLVFAMDDYLTIHERIGGWVADRLDLWTLLTNNVDDVITLGYGFVGLVALHFFRHEVMEIRTSSVLYLAGVLAAGLMLITDAYAQDAVVLLEFPAQFGAVGLLLLAHLQRFREVGEPPGVGRVDSGELNSGLAVASVIGRNVGDGDSP